MVKIDNKKIRVSKDGFFAFGLDRDRKNNVVIIIKEDGKTKTIEKQILKRKFHKFSNKKLTIRTNIRGTKIQYFCGGKI